MEEQQSLFDQSNKLKIEFQKKLSEFRFDKAIEILEEIGKSFGKPRNFNDKLSALETLSIQTMRIERSDAAALAGYYVTLEKQDFIKNLESEWLYIRGGVIGEISRRIDSAFIGYIVPGFHAAEVCLEMGELDRSVDMVFRYMEEYGEDALLRQIQSCVYKQKGDMIKARRCLCMALFNNPLSCQERFLKDMEIAEEWRLLQDQTNPEKAWIELPFVLWKEGQIVIDGKPNQFECFIMEEAEKANKGEGNLPSPGIQFIRLLYLAESFRQRQDRDGKMMDYRMRLRMIDPAKYAEYMAAVSQLEKATEQ